ncbi:MAG: hypothetical protein JSV04_00935 [Candidatus Heimdallarchaeota archaeon]|nr:MAG: hypothetical protein JSV04_00935 [Candidatus Heimdallarchaeota archaeon]
MVRDLEEQMRLSLRGILSKQMARGGNDKHQVIASFIGDDSGFPLLGLKRMKGESDSIVEMKIDEFEQICALIPQMWEAANPFSDGLLFVETEEEEINHLIVGLKKKESTIPHLELMITRLEELFLSSVYYTKKR